MYELPQLLDGLNSVITIPIIPFRNGEIDFAAHRKNVEYLMRQNSLSGDRPRVICVAGTSLIHHVGYEDQNRLIEETADVMSGAGILLSAIAPNPISSAENLVRRLLEMNRAPDGFLLMPLTGVYSVEGLYDGFADFVSQFVDARFLYYLRQSRDCDSVANLMNDFPNVVAVKIGTTEDDVVPMIEKIGDSGMVIWGIGDRSTKSAQLGSRGHTSGISVLFAKAGDEINNAHRSGDFQRALEIEKRIDAFESVRFENGRVYNYSAVVEAMIQSGFNDIDAGEGGPFNPRVYPEVAARVQDAIRDIMDLH